MQERTREALVDLLPEAADMDVDDVGLRIEMIVPDIFEQHRPRHHLTGAAHKEFEQAKLAWQKVDLLPAALHCPRQQVHLDIGHLEPRRRRVAAATAQQRLYPCEELGEGE